MIQPIQPTADELLHAMALLIVENDAWRASSGKPVLSEGRRTWERDRLTEARALKPAAEITGLGTLVVSLNG